MVYIFEDVELGGRSRLIKAYCAILWKGLISLWLWGGIRVQRRSTDRCMRAGRNMGCVGLRCVAADMARFAPAWHRRSTNWEGCCPKAIKSSSLCQ
jgi:hypothetical protein